MKYSILTLFATACFFIACNSSDDEQSESAEMTTVMDDSVSTVKDDNAIPNETIQFINETGFAKYAKSKLEDFKWDEFTVTRFWKEDFQHKADFNPDQNYYSSYGRFLKYSPDSSMFIDLDSYNIAIRKDKQGRLIGNDQGPDTEVSLVDVKKKQRQRLLFLGPGNGVQDGGWIDNENLVLIGFQENANASGTSAVVWRFNLPSKMVYLYELAGEDAVNHLMDYSRKERLKEVTMQ